MRLKVSFFLFLFAHLSAQFLPETHPLKAKLDTFFSAEGRILANPDSVQAAGFSKPEPRKWSHLIVSRHPNMKGYLFKMYTDDLEEVDEWEHWRKRIEGAKALKKAIYCHGFQDRFAVPKKWIYTLPTQIEGKKNSILVVQDMHILPHKKNLFKWKKGLPAEDFAAYVQLVEEVGLHDSIYPFNVPFTKWGKLAFIDTEDFDHWPIPFDKLLPYLSAENQQHLPN